MTFGYALAIYVIADEAWQQHWPHSRPIEPPRLLHRACPGHATPILALPVQCAGCGLVFPPTYKEQP